MYTFVHYWHSGDIVVLKGTPVHAGVMGTVPPLTLFENFRFSRKTTFEHFCRTTHTLMKKKQNKYVIGFCFGRTILD